MKKYFACLLLGIVSCVGWASCSDNDDVDEDITISFYDLPSKAITFVNDYFPNDKVVRVDYDVDHKDSKYEVTFQSGLEVEFDAGGQWISIDAPDFGSVPDAVVPADILSYVQSQYPGARITDISREYYGYEVDLSNNIDLKFNPDGSFLGIDR